MINNNVRHEKLKHNTFTLKIKNLTKSCCSSILVFEISRIFISPDYRSRSFSFSLSLPLFACLYLPFYFSLFLLTYYISRLTRNYLNRNWWTLIIRVFYSDGYYVCLNFPSCSNWQSDPRGHRTVNSWRHCCFTGSRYFQCSSAMSSLTIAS